MRNGTTVAEAIVVLLLLGIVVGLAVPSAREVSERWAVESARDRLRGRVSGARFAAVTHGGSNVQFFSDPPAYRRSWVPGDSIPQHFDFQPGVSLALPRSRDSLTLRFDPLGIGRFASATLELRRGGTRSELIVSSYGRIRTR